MAEGIPGLLRWAPSTSFKAGEKLAAPNGDIVTANIDFTTGATYSATNLTPSSQDTRLGGVEGGLAQTRKQVPDINGVAGGFLDPTGRLSELVIGTDGRVPDWALAAWNKRLGVKSAAFPLTGADSSTSLDTRTAVGARIPFKLPADAIAFRVHIHNNNNRYVFNYAGALSFDGLAFGPHDMGTTGTHTGKFLGTPTTIATGFTTSATGATEWVSPWVEADLAANKDYLLSYGYTCAAQNNASTVAGSWQSTNNTSWNAVEDVGAVLASHTPCDIWLELKVADSVRSVAFLTDSLGLGVSTRLPVYDSFPMQHARANGYLPLMYSHSGSTMDGWAAAPTSLRFTKWAAMAKPDALVWSLARNDIFASGADLATLRSRFAALYPIITGVTSTNVYLTTVLPSFDAAAPAEAVRQAWNNVLLDELPGNAVTAFDLGKAVESSTVGVLDSRYSAGPGNIHLNRQGDALCARTINQPLHR
ncbi:hypothetical protein FQP90_13560 [Paenarthrobacter nitroguajacolicus]|uniref:Uncharacterized protein n=1 Tax=Paenarthrobacter nitroguajacolicus TaxID=211146 RepID=A0A558GXL4_PAENT|nr:hypothetical protein [Paenarthrobacter nitroguajacolicus]TVU61562.1 hypothetical protein FQP90_13560 [Paenarthrobacter nitroguajacolicus]